MCYYKIEQNLWMGTRALLQHHRDNGLTKNAKTTEGSYHESMDQELQRKRRGQGGQMSSTEDGVDIL